MPEAHAVPAAPRPTVAVAGLSLLFPVHRIYCVGRNFPEHARELGARDERAPPFFFAKPADAVVEGGQEAARACVYGYSVGVDLTRRDVQAAMKEQGKPWDVAKGFDHSAPIAPIVPVARTGHPATGRIWLAVNDDPRQQGDIADMIWSVPEIIAELSTWFELASGDLIFTGTPAGVAALLPGDRVRGGVDGVAELAFTMAAA